MSTWKTKPIATWSNADICSCIREVTVDNAALTASIRAKMVVVMTGNITGSMVEAALKDDNNLFKGHGMSTACTSDMMDAFDEHDETLKVKEKGTVAASVDGNTNGTFTVYVVDGINKTHEIPGARSSMTILDFKRLIYDRIGISNVGLSFKGALNDAKTLEYCGIKHETIVHTVLRLKGGTTDPNSNSNSNSGLKGKGKVKRHRINWRKNRHLKKFITEEGDCLFGYTRSEGFHVVAMEPCKHAMESQAMFLYIESIFAKHNSVIKIVCPVSGCKKEWDWQTCCQVAGMSKEEYISFSTMFNNRARGDTRECPHCHRMCERTPGVAILRMRCPCSNADWCWLCAKPWKGSGLMICGETECAQKIELFNDTLAKCAWSVPTYWKNAVKLPDIRSCPHCLVFMQKDGACKHMTCRGCSTKFCFSCLAIGTKSAYPKCNIYNESTDIAAESHKGLCHPHKVQHFH